MSKTKKASVSDVVFVKACGSAKSVAQAAAALNLTPNAVYTRIKSLRAKGVKLPEYERQGRVKDVEGLNALLADLNGTVETTADESVDSETVTV